MGLVPVGAGSMNALEHHLHGLPQIRDEARATSNDPLLGITLMRKWHRGQQSMINRLSINHRLETPEHPISMTKRRRSIGHVAPEHPLLGRRCSTSLTAPDHLFLVRKRRRSTPDYPSLGRWRMKNKQDYKLQATLPWKGENITIFLISAYGKQITISLCQFSTIYDLRKLCLSKDPTLQTDTILYGAKTLKDNLRLYDYNVGNGSTIFSLAKMKGGMPKKHTGISPMKTKPHQGQHSRQNTEEDHNSIYQFFQEDEAEIQEKKGQIQHAQTYKLYTDGAARGNPGLSGVGYIIETEIGRNIFNNNAFLGESTNNKAEYTALIYGLRSCTRLGISNLRVYSDSKLAINQITGTWKTNEQSLQIYNNEAKELCTMFETIELNWIAREHNEKADKLANAAIPKHDKTETKKQRSTPGKKGKKLIKVAEGDDTTTKNGEGIKSAQKTIRQYFTPPKEQKIDEESEYLRTIDELLKKDRDQKTKDSNPEIESKLDKVEIEEMLDEDIVGSSLANYDAQNQEENYPNRSGDNYHEYNLSKANSEQEADKINNSNRELKHLETSQMEAFFHMMKALITQTNKRDGELQQNHKRETYRLEGTSREEINQLESSINNVHHRSVSQEQGVHHLMELGSYLLQQNNQIEAAIGEISNYGNNEFLPWKHQVTDGVSYIYNSMQAIEDKSNTTVQGCRTLESWVLELAEEIKALKDENKILKEKIREINCSDSAESETSLPKAFTKAILQNQRKIFIQVADVLRQWKDEQEQWLRDMEDKLEEMNKHISKNKERHNSNVRLSESIKDSENIVPESKKPSEKKLLYAWESPTGTIIYDEGLKNIQKIMKDREYNYYTRNQRNQNRKNKNSNGKYKYKDPKRYNRPSYNTYSNYDGWNSEQYNQQGMHENNQDQNFQENNRFRKGPRKNGYRNEWSTENTRGAEYGYRGY